MDYISYDNTYVDDIEALKKELETLEKRVQNMLDWITTMSLVFFSVVMMAGLALWALR